MNVRTPTFGHAIGSQAPRDAVTWAGARVQTQD